MFNRSLLVWLLASGLLYTVLIGNISPASPIVKIGQPAIDRVEVSPTPLPVEKEVVIEKKIVVPEEELTPEEWGVAKQIDDVTWTIKVGQDTRMTTADELLVALNDYRSRHGAGGLSRDGNLAGFAKARAAYFASIGGLDQHKGFIEYAESEENMRKLGFYGVGENASYGYKLEGVHLIEWIFAADEPHDRNQRDAEWTHVGIGIEGTGVAIIFAKWRM